MEFLKKQFYNIVGDNANNNNNNNNNNNSSASTVDGVLFDPRSPSKLIKRTPFKNNFKNNYYTYTSSHIVDPRSPSSNRFKRSPIQLNKIKNNKTTTSTTTTTSPSSLLIDPRSPSNNKFKRSPIPHNNNRIKTVKPLLLFDPRSPSLKFVRTPIKSNINTDPRSPSLMIDRTPINHLKEKQDNQVEEEICSTPYTFKSINSNNNNNDIQTISNSLQDDNTITLSFNEMLKNEIISISSDDNDTVNVNDSNVKQVVPIVNKDVDTIVNEQEEILNENVKQNNDEEIEIDNNNNLINQLDSLIIQDLKQDLDTSNQLSKSNELLLSSPMIIPLNTRLSKLQKSRDVFRSSPSLLISPSKRLSVINSSPKPIRNSGILQPSSPSANGSNTPTKRLSSFATQNNNQENTTSSNNLLNYFSCDSTTTTTSSENNPNSLNKIQNGNATPTKRLSTLNGSGGITNNNNLTPTTKRNSSIHKVNLLNQKHSSTSNLSIYH